MSVRTVRPVATLVTSQIHNELLAALSLHFKKPVMIVEGKMQYLFDEKGKRYLDVSFASCRSDWSLPACWSNLQPLSTPM